MAADGNRASRFVPGISRLGLVLLWGLAPFLGLIAQAVLADRRDPRPRAPWLRP